MTYRRFHFYFNLPLLILLGILAYPAWSFHDTLITLGLCLIVIIFTTPWDNWAVKRNLWNFPKNRILFRVWHCPIEEYLFFLTQTIQACLLADILRYSFFKGAFFSKPEPHYQWAAALALAWLLLFFLFRNLSFPKFLTYLRHLLFWMLPIIFFQWTMGGIWIQQPVLIFTTAFVLGTLLVVFDSIAINQGLWFFDETQTLNIKFLRLIPIEEILFFYLTTLMVIQGFLLFT